MQHFESARGDVAALASSSERTAFLRRTYTVLGVALLGWVGLTAGMMTLTPELSLGWSQMAMGGRWSWLLVMGAFMAVGYAAERMARSDTSQGLQLAGLALFVVAQSFIVQPMLWIAIAMGTKSGNFDPQTTIMQAAGITGVVFVGLTSIVFITKKDFSFMRGVLTVLSFAALGIIILSLIFGFNLGTLFSGAMVALMAGYILFQTSMVMQTFPTNHHVAAALMLFSTIATLFWYVLRLLMESRR